MKSKFINVWGKVNWWLMPDEIYIKIIKLRKWRINPNDLITFYLWYFDLKEKV